jgi:hypothetical protein
MFLESILTFGRRIIALVSRLFLACLEEARASPPAAPATAAPPATNGSFALLTTLPSPLPEPFDRAPFELGDFGAGAFAFAAFFAAFGLVDFEDDFALFGADRPFVLVFV